MTCRRLAPTPPNIRERARPAASIMVVKPMFDMSNNDPNANATNTSEAPMAPMSADNV